MVRSAPLPRIRPDIFVYVLLLAACGAAGGVRADDHGGAGGGRADDHRGAGGDLRADTRRAPVETVILLSWDGTRPVDIASPQLPTLARLRREGASASALVPVFPSNTFPNHVSLVTGVRSQHHGVVNNVFLDPERGKHSYANDPTWLQAEPLWSLLARHGIVSAAYYWVGSEGPWTSGLGPKHWHAFDSKTPNREKVEQILAWLDLEDPRERPRFVSAWFHGADGPGHRDGPGSPAALESLQRQDVQLGRLVAGLETRGLLARTILILVSDHGMARVERVVDPAAALDDAGIRARLLGAGGFAIVALEDPADAARAVELARSRGISAWRREDVPPELGAANPRFGDVVLMAPVGTAMVREGLGGTVQKLLRKTGVSMRGSHGHAPDHPEMAGIFIAFGADVPAGLELGMVSALDVAPTVLALFGLPIPETMTGRPLLGGPHAATGRPLLGGPDAATGRPLLGGPDAAGRPLLGGPHAIAGRPASGGAVPSTAPEREAP